jgi:catechol 2,3-dioxygenase-like lactoylglutathione lyase family enzyme
MNRIIGVDHVGIGVKDMIKMKSFYQNVLEFTKIFGEMPEIDHPPIQPLLRTSLAVHSGIQFCQEAGGVSLALFHSITPIPRPIRKDFTYGDIGVNKITIAVSSVENLKKAFPGKLNFCSEQKRVFIPGWGDYSFIYAKDPEGNLIEFVSSSRIQITSQFGGIHWIGVSVTELKRSKEFYQKYLGFDKTVIEDHDVFSGAVDEVSGHSTQVHSCVVSNSKGNGMVELFEVIQPRGRSIPFATNWGDFGYLQVCLLGNNIQEIEEYFEKAGMEFLLRPQIIDDPNLAGLSFLYVRDPDGIPIEVMVLPGK